MHLRTLRAVTPSIERTTDGVTASEVTLDQYVYDALDLVEPDVRDTENHDLKPSG